MATLNTTSIPRFLAKPGYNHNPQPDTPLAAQIQRGGPRIQLVQSPRRGAPLNEEFVMPPPEPYNTVFKEMPGDRQIMPNGKVAIGSRYQAPLLVEEIEMNNRDVTRYSPAQRKGLAILEDIHSAGHHYHHHSHIASYAMVFAAGVFTGLSIFLFYR